MPKRSEVDLTSVFKELLERNPQARAFDLMRRGRAIPFPLMVRLLLHGVFVEPFLFAVRYFPGTIGMGLRQVWARLRLGSCGKNVLVDFATTIDGAENVFLDDYVWVDHHCQLNARVGHIRVGKRVHIAPYTIISGAAGVTIEDYVGIASFVQIYSHSERPKNGLRISGPMIPEEQKGMQSGPIVLKKDSFVGAGAVILPGVTLHEGAVVGANSLVTKDVDAWTIAVGVPARAVGRRTPVSVPDL
jgi:dTDP-4-amino-4,6-dideoxy-D-glucose acyltransferase